MSANLEAIGEFGAQILSDVDIPPGSKIRINCETREFTGYVQSSGFDYELGYFIDLEFDQGSRWSEGWFVPQHLLRCCEYPTRVFPLKVA